MPLWDAFTKKGKTETKSTNELLEIILSFFGAEFWDEAKRIVEENPELLTPNAISTMTLLCADADDWVKRNCLESQDLLHRCMEMGIEKSFSEKMSPLKTIDAKLLSRFKKAVVARDAKNIYNFLSEYPELQAAWKNCPYPKGNMFPPPGFEAELKLIGQLEDKAREDQSAGEQLIQAYLHILEKLPHDRYLAFRATIQNDLGVTYSRRRWGNSTTNNTQAIYYYQEALRYWTPENVPHEYAATQMNLGRKYRELQSKEIGENEIKAITCFKEALRIYNLADSPDKYAMAQCELATAYFDLPLGNRGDNLIQAINCFKESLNFYNARSQSLRHQYGRVQYSLGECYRILPTGDKTTNLETAIEYFQKALLYLNLTNDPSLYVKAWSHQGEAHRDIQKGERARNLISAIKCFREAQRNKVDGITPEEYTTIQNNLDLCINEARLFHLSAEDTSSSITSTGETSKETYLHYFLHRQLHIPYHESLLIQFDDTFNTLYKRLLPYVSRIMNTSQQKLLDKINLKLSEEPLIKAFVETSTSGITISIYSGLMQFIARLLFLFFCQIDIEMRKVPFSRIPADELDRLTLSLVNDFWVANGNISQSMDDTFKQIEKLVDDDRMIIPFINDIYGNIGSFVISHELGHIILNEKKQKKEKIPGDTIANFFIKGLEEQGLIDDFAKLTRMDPKLISQMWIEELCADAIALDVGLSQEPVVGFLASHLTDSSLKSIPQYNSIAFGKAFHLSIDLFFMLLHMLDIFYTRKNRIWVPMQSHPPSLVRLIFMRSFYKPPQAMAAATDDDEPMIFTDVSRVLFGKKYNIFEHDSDLSLSRFTSNMAFSQIVGNLVYYLKFYLNKEKENTQTYPDIKMADIVPAVGSDPIFKVDENLTIANAFGEAIERILSRCH